MQSQETKELDFKERCGETVGPRRPVAEPPLAASCTGNAVKNVVVKAPRRGDETGSRAAAPLMASGGRAPLRRLRIWHYTSAKLFPAFACPVMCTLKSLFRRSSCRSSQVSKWRFTSSIIAGTSSSCTSQVQAS